MIKAIIDVGEPGSATTLYLNAGTFRECRHIVEDATRLEFRDGRVMVNFYDHQPLCSKIKHAIKEEEETNADNN